MRESEIETGPGPARQARRLAWLDVLRGLAAIGMIETHTLNVFLAPNFQSSPFVGWITFFNGLVAPAFLWIAGYVHGLGVWRRLDSPGPHPVPARIVGRLVLVWAIGYGLHFPWPGSAPNWASFFAIDILACLAASLMILVGIEWLIGRWPGLPTRQTAVIVIVVILAAAAIGLAPAASHWRSGVAGVDAYFNGSLNPLFPLLPWFGFVAVGFVMSRWTMPPWLVAALGAAAAAIPQAAVFNKAAPAFFIARLGWLWLAIAAISLICRKWTAPRWLHLAGRESLVIYVAHLILIYWLPLAARWGGSLSPAGVVILFVLLTLASLAVAAANAYRRRNRTLPSTIVN